MTAAALPAAAAPIEKPARKDEAGEAARMLEAYFLRRIMAEVRTSNEGGLLAPGFGGQVFSEMLDEALADRMAEGGGVGLAAMVKKQLGGEIAAAASSAAAGPASARTVRQAYGAAPAAHPFHPPVGAPAPVPAPATAPMPAPALDPAGEQAADKLWHMPVEARRISSGFGKIRLDPTRPSGTRTHQGIDMAAPIGTPVHAARGGQVVRAEPSTGGFGNVVVIDHGGGVQSYYGHLSAILVEKGQVVDTGTLVGEVGSTGHSTGPHLHFEVRQDGISIDPTSDIAGLKIDRTRTNR
ncbi:MAG TPA: peptidoglycan DD-metalloendopeptidase family protein [Kofleriaceae bacterium]|nr:peptidoglycan DD-metalloendopeptidase family protein [Kofleriaceae bacterium]